VRKSKKLAFSIISVVFLSQLSAVQANAISQGEDCTQINQIRKSGKTEFKCVGLESLSYWIQLPSVVPLQKSASKVISKWQSIAQLVSFPELISQSDIDAANSDLEKTNSSLKQVTQSLSKSQESENSFKTTAVNLNASAQQYTNLVVDKKKIHDTKSAEYSSALSKTKAYESQYNSALSSRSATLSCTILRDFGFVGSCANSAFQDALDVQTIRTYNSLKAASDAAYSEYSIAYDSWIATFKLETKEIQRAKLASDTAELYSQRTSEWEALSDFVVTQQEYVQEFLKAAEIDSELQSDFSRLPAQVENAISMVKSARKNNYKTRYLTAYALVQYLQMAQKYYQSKVDEKQGYSKLQITIQDPQIWAPKSYFKGSVYSDIENTSGIDFAWSWSARSACELTSSCKNLFIVTEKDCLRSVVVLDFMTDAKVSESKTTSKEYSLKAGEISLIEAESKFSTSATTLNLRSFKCISQ